MIQNSIKGRKDAVGPAKGSRNIRRRLAGWLAGSVALLSLVGSTLAQSVSVVLSNDPSLKFPSFLTTDGTNLFVSGIGADNNQYIFTVPITSGPATVLYAANNPYQDSLVGSNIYWIDPNSGPITDTQILHAPASGTGTITAIYTGSSQGQPIVDGSGLASDGILVYAADEVSGTVWRMKPDGSALTQLGPARYSGGFGPEHLNTVAVSQGVIYLADHGSSGSGISPSVVSISTNGGSFTTLASGAPLVAPSGIAVGGASIYVADPASGNTIWQLPTNGGAPAVLVQGGAFKSIQGLCYLNGGLFVCDSAAGAIYRITLTQPTFQSATYLGTSGADLTGLSIKCSAGAAYVAGYNSAIGGFLSRYNSPMVNNASPAWSFYWPGSDASDQFAGVTASAAGVYAAGPNYSQTTDTVGGKESKGMVVKFPLNGATGAGFEGDTWDIQTPAPPGAFSYGGFEGLRGVTLAAENGTSYLYTTGSGQHDFSNGGRLFISKLSDNGSTAAVLWTQTDGAEMVNEDYSTGIAVAALNTNVYVAGLLSSSSISQQAYLRKYDSAGGLVWVRVDNYASCYNGVTALGNEIYAVGWSGTNNGPGSAIDFLIEKWDENGNQIWTKTYDRNGAEDCLNGVVAMGNRLFVTGYTRGQTAGGADAILMEIDPATGAALSETTFGGAQDDVANSIDTDGTDLYLAGTTRSFGNGSNDVMVLRYSLQPALVSLGVTPANPIIGAGTNLQFTAIGHYTDGSLQTVSNAAWTSATTSVASINGSGLAQGLSQGTSLVTAGAAGVSNSTLLTVVVHPTISVEPVNVTAGPGGTVTFNITAGGGALSYQWQLNGTNISGATSSTFTLSNLNPAESGAYTVVVSNAAGSTSSTAAELSLLSLNMYAGLMIVGQVGAAYEIDYNNSLAGTNWSTLTNLVLPASPYIFFDTSSPFSPSRFYRALKQ